MKRITFLFLLSIFIFSICLADDQQSEPTNYSSIFATGSYTGEWTGDYSYYVDIKSGNYAHRQNVKKKFGDEIIDSNTAFIIKDEESYHINYEDKKVTVLQIPEKFKHNAEEYKHFSEPAYKERYFVALKKELEKIDYELIESEILGYKCQQISKKGDKNHTCSFYGIPLEQIRDEYSARVKNIQVNQPAPAGIFEIPADFEKIKSSWPFPNKLNKDQNGDQSNKKLSPEEMATRAAKFIKSTDSLFSQTFSEIDDLVQKYKTDFDGLQKKSIDEFEEAEQKEKEKLGPVNEDQVLDLVKKQHCYSNAGYWTVKRQLDLATPDEVVGLVGKLHDQLSSEVDYIRKNALDFLEAIKPASEETITQAIDKIGDASWEVRLAAVYLLKWSDDERVIPVLNKALESEKHLKVQDRLASTIVWKKADENNKAFDNYIEQAIPRFIDQLQSSDNVETTRAAIMQLSGLNTHANKALVHLYPFARSEDISTRVLAINSIGEVSKGEDEAAEIILDALNNNDQRVSQMACLSLSLMQISDKTLKRFKELEKSEN